MQTTEAEIKGFIIKCPTTNELCQIFFVDDNVNVITEDDDVDGVTTFDCPLCGKTHTAIIALAT